MNRARLPLDRVSRGSMQVKAVTVFALVWGRLWGGTARYDETSNLLVCESMRGGHARAGTCVGAVFLTGTPLRDPRRGMSPERQRALLHHESVHADQWARYGVSFVVRYLVEEMRHPGAANRFEIAAGLEGGGYVRRRS